VGHVDEDVKKPADLKVQQNNTDGQKSVFEQLRGAWWMCPDVPLGTKMLEDDNNSVPVVALIPMSTPGTGMPNNSSTSLPLFVQRLVAELAMDGADRGDRARDSVYGEVVDPLLTQGDGIKHVALLN
jgi:hypothetical protein